MFEEDYIMRLIKDFTRMIAKVVFHADTESPLTEFLKDERTRENAKGIATSIDGGDIRSALDSLNALSGENTLDNLKLGLAVFSELSDIDEDVLERSGCTSADIAATFRRFVTAFGLEGMAGLYVPESESVIREALPGDLDGLLSLYTHLHERSIPDHDDRLASVWDRILNDRSYHIIVAEKDGKIVSSCTCLIVPNLTHNVHPYALIENVVTHRDYRNTGLGTACLNYACKLAEREGCYKAMLMTGSKEESTLRFYERAGFSRGGKTAFNRVLSDD
jgi:GNAT superfamily N-acetyltransferase